MLYTLIVIVHVFICFLMIGAILLQSGKGAEIGAAFGGSSQTVFGSRGPANFLSKLTVIVAAVFMVTSLTLAILAKQRNFSSTIIDMQPKSDPQLLPLLLLLSLQGIRILRERLPRLGTDVFLVRPKPRHIHVPSASERITCVSISAMGECCVSNRSETRHRIQRHSPH